MKRFFSWGIGLATCLLLAACGGGGGGSAGITPNPQTYTSSASAGELISYTIDRNSLTYSYTITKSSYGCELPSAPCHSGSGSLIKNSDGTYSPSTSPSSKIHVLENGLLFGTVTLSINGANRTVPILGVQNPATAVADLAGTYNFISLQCGGRTYGIFTGCSTYQGTVKVNSDGSYSTCEGGNLSANTPNCITTTSGRATSLGSGVFSLQATLPSVGSATNYMVAFRAPNGQKVGFLDFNDSIRYGYGQAIISNVVDITPADVAGTYIASDDYGGTGTVTVNANLTTSFGETITYNQPWAGISTISSNTYGDGYSILAGNGVYVYRNPNIPNRSAYYQIGLRLN